MWVFAGYMRMYIIFMLEFYIILFVLFMKVSCNFGRSCGLSWNCENLEDIIQVLPKSVVL